MLNDQSLERILILDFGSQYTQLIARKIREQGVYCDIQSPSIDDEALQAYGASGVILSGGPNSVSAEDAPVIPGRVFQLGVPVLGICYGMQAMAQQLGGAVAGSDNPEYGAAELQVLPGAGLLADLQDRVDEQGQPRLKVWMSHGDHVTVLPLGFRALAATDDTPYAAIADETRHFYGLQCHPEVTHTLQGELIIKRFVLDICGCDPVWTVDNIIDQAVADIQAKVGDDGVLVALSGGVDSAVVASLVHRAVGNQLTCLMVDHGLLRLGEVAQVEKVFSAQLGVNLLVVDAKDMFLGRLQGVVDPEEKRRIIGHAFIEVFEAEAQKLGATVKWLGQGTIYPDVIESAGIGGHAHVIKSHHNVGGLPDDMTLQLLEPLRSLFKDEVRRVGLALGLPASLIERHPFPGPGLAVRILGDVNQEALSIVAAADHIFLQVLQEMGWLNRVSQAFAVFIPQKAVGVKGDQRHYGYVIVLRAVITVDFMTADWAPLPVEVLQQASDRITREVPAVGRVVYDVTPKPPGTIEWE